MVDKCWLKKERTGIRQQTNRKDAADFNLCLCLCRSKNIIHVSAAKRRRSFRWTSSVSVPPCGTGGPRGFSSSQALQAVQTSVARHLSNNGCTPCKPLQNTKVHQPEIQMCIRTFNMNTHMTHAYLQKCYHMYLESIHVYYIYIIVYII